jgi:DNA damage-binding protein 1
VITQALDDDTYLGAENAMNLFTLRKNSEAGTDDERSKLELVGDFHLGEFINRFRPGSLVMRLPDSEAAKIPTVIFGTVNGVIGVVASLPSELFVLVQRLETALNKVRAYIGFRVRV